MKPSRQRKQNNFLQTSIEDKTFPWLRNNVDILFVILAIIGLDIVVFLHVVKEHVAIKSRAGFKQACNCVAVVINTKHIPILILYSVVVSIVFAA